MSEKDNPGFTPQNKGMMEQVQATPTPVEEVLKEGQGRYELMDALNEVPPTPEELHPDDPAGTKEEKEEKEEEESPNPQAIQIGRVVTYRSRTGNYDVPAIVNCTVNTIYQPGVELGYVPPISKTDNVHLTVLTPGRPGMRVTGSETHAFDMSLSTGLCVECGKAQTEHVLENFVVKSPYPVSENVAGCYQEWDIPYDPKGGPGTWRWPSRV